MATSWYDKAYCANHIEAYDERFRNGSRAFNFSRDESRQICSTATPSTLWQNIIPTILLLIAFANYIPIFIQETFLRDRVLSYLLFIKQNVDQSYGDIERIMRFAKGRRENLEDKEDLHFKELEKQFAKWQGKQLSRWYFIVHAIRLLLLVGECLLLGLWERLRFDQIRQEFVCCVDREFPVMCTYSKYYTLLIIWLVSFGALTFCTLITLRGIVFILAEVACSCQLCHNHTMKICKRCPNNWCQEHQDGCDVCGKCRCKPDCRSHVYSRICGSPIACCPESERKEDLPGAAIFESASGQPVDAIRLDMSKADTKTGVDPKVQIKATGGECCVGFPSDYHFISHLCYANCHAMKLLMIVNIMDHLAGNTTKPENNPAKSLGNRLLPFSYLLSSTTKTSPKPME